LAWRRREEKLANDPRLRRRREVARHIHESLRNFGNKPPNGKAMTFLRWDSA